MLRFRFSALLGYTTPLYLFYPMGDGISFGGVGVGWGCLLFAGIPGSEGWELGLLQIWRSGLFGGEGIFN
jgi:hypothetical protein